MEERGIRSGRERIVAIDALRGIAILWVITFHLWGDMEFFPGVPREYYEQLTWQWRHGNGAWAILTSATDLLFRDGFQGVPLFMMLSGLSLTIAAYRSGDALRWPRFLVARFQKLLIPYWAGVAITYAVIAAIAWRQVALHGGSFGSSFGGGVTISLHSMLSIDRGVAIASVTLVPRLLRPEWFFAPQLALWFVGLLAQYYLLFPLLFLLLRKIGVVAFLALTFGVTVAANYWIVDQYGAPEFKFWLVTGWAPFRLFEFTSGMGLGWLLASPERHRALAFVRRPAVVIGALVVGFAAHTAGDLLIGQWAARYWQALALPLVTLGIALIVLPVLVRWPSAISAAAPVRGLATLGVMSYALLIVNDPMRLVASQLRLEGVSDAVWWTFVVAVYVPASVVLAWPLARLLGLMPQAERRVAEVTEEQPRALPEAVEAVLV